MVTYEHASFNMFYCKPHRAMSRASPKRSSSAHPGALVSHGIADLAAVACVAGSRRVKHGSR